MKAIIIIFVSIFSISVSGYTQTFDWANSLKGPFANGLTVFTQDIDADIDGNLYVTGNYSGTINIGSFQLQNGGMYIAKYNSSGTLLWVRKADNIGSLVPKRSDIACDNSGNFYITGIYSNPTKMFVAKYDSSGTNLWIKTSSIGGPLSDIQAVYASVDNSGNCYVAGSFAGTIRIDTYTISSFGRSDVFISKFSSNNGICLWAKSGGSDNGDEGCDGLTVDPVNNDVYLAARFMNPLTNPATFNGNVTVTNSGYTRFFIKYASNGNSLTGIEYGSIGVSKNCIGVDVNSQVYLLDRYGILKFDQSLSSPQRIWTTDLNLTGMETDLNGNCYVFGRAENLSDVFAAKINSEGEVNWIKTIDRVSGTNSGNDICCDPTAGNAYLACDYTGTSNFGSITLTTPNFGVYYTSSYVTKISDLKSIELKYRLEAMYPTLDEITVSLVRSTAPFDIIESSTVMSQLDGNKYKSSSSFSGVPVNSYYIVVKHRNSIETWSANPVSVNSGTTVYDFSTSANMAYGNNMKPVNSSHDVYAFFSGDVNQDGMIDNSDLNDIYNAGIIFSTGSLNTDLTGDGIVDISDLFIAYNNGLNFVSVIKP